MATEIKIERRSMGEVRAADGDKFQICGYAAMFNSRSKDLGGFRESIAPGAFKASLDRGDECVALFNHDANQILGRRSAGTLEVKEDNKGLYFCTQLDESNSQHRDLFASIKRGDIGQCSFAFTVAPNGAELDEVEENGVRFLLRTLRKVNLIDVSAVTYPAYEATSVDARNLTGDELLKHARAVVDRIFTDDPVGVAKAMLKQHQ